MLTQSPRTGPLLPLLPPPLASTTFNLPSLPPRASAFLFEDRTDWICETFTFPGAYPRSVPGCVRLKSERRSGNELEEKTTIPFEAGLKSDVARLVEAMYDAQVNAVLADSPIVSTDEGDCEEERLFIAVNRYRKVRTGVKKEEGLTMVFAHANGFHKGVYGYSHLAKQDTHDRHPLFNLCHLQFIRNLGTNSRGNHKTNRSEQELETNIRNLRARLC